MSLPPSGVFDLSFRFAFGVSLPFGLRLALSLAPMFCLCLPAPVFQFLDVRCLSDCRLPLLFFSCRGPVHACLFLLAWSLYISLFAFFPSSLSLSTLWSLLPLSWGFFFFSFFAIGSGLLSYTLCSPFFTAVAQPCTNSGFRVLHACSVLLPHSLGILFFICLFASVSSSSHLLGSTAGVQVSVFACRLLRRFLAKSRGPIWALGFAFLFSSSTFLFLVFPHVFLGPCVVTCVSLPLVPPPLSDHLLLLGASLSPLLLPSGCFCCLVHCFAFLRLFSPGLGLVFSSSSCSLALSLLSAVVSCCVSELCYPISFI